MPSEWGPIVGAAGGIAAAAVTGWLLIGRERVTQAVPATATAVEGFNALVGRLETEVARLSLELADVRDELAAARHEVAECERSRDEIEARLAVCERRMAESGVMDRRTRNDGPPNGGPERRTP